MSIEFCEFIKVAKRNISDDQGEIGVRTAVSRGYYAMYHACLNLSGPVPRSHPLNGTFKGGTHSRLAQYMTECSKLISSTNEMEVRKLGVKLKMYHKYRCDADYELSKNINEKYAEIVIAEAENIAESVRLVSPSVA
ncbi:hypothetical protein FDW94_07185 [Citrobacter sp. wls757]|uniref:hypothetical protein n=1 Tax=Citrobacter sp. wls757 TaxID=2576417 RepID=UPI0010C935B3|nr:hypothetical protein [Citrobacter sp. wls757]TKU47851.1 hypothetical protein FDW94_07185 [Citrobacter sp. wls757]